MVSVVRRLGHILVDNAIESLIVKKRKHLFLGKIVKGGVFLKGNTHRLGNQHLHLFGRHFKSLAAGAVIGIVNVLAPQVNRFLLFLRNKDKQQVFSVIRFYGVFNLNTM